MTEPIIEEAGIFEIGSSQVKVGVFGFTVAWKKLPDFQNFIETPIIQYS